jgi:putative ABC transport system permease protein
MARIAGIRRLFRFPASEDQVRGDVHDEIAFHVEERTQELIARGMARDAARAAALREFGDVSEARVELEEIGRQRVRQIRRADWWSDLRQDLRYGVRSLLHARLFSLLAIVTLALGIGANAAVFGVLKSVLLDALPYREAERLVRVHGGLLKGAERRGSLSAGTISDIAERQRSFESLAGFVEFTTEVVYGANDGARIVRIASVEPGFFETLGVTPAQGRTFQNGEGSNGLAMLGVGEPTGRVAIVSHAAWRQLLAGDPDVLGRDVRIDGVPRAVIGVLPRDFVGPMGEADFYLAFDRGPVVAHPVFARGTGWLGLVARVKPGVTYEAAERDVAAIWDELAREYPSDNGSRSLETVPLRDAMVGDTRTPLLVLMASAGLVLFIACANLAAALLSRMLSRRKEFAVRMALGAGRGRLVRQVLTESTVLALAGGAVGLLVAELMLSLLRGLALPVLPDYVDLSLDRGAIAVTALLAVCTGLAFGIAPAFSVDRADAQATLRNETRGASESRRSRYLRGALVAGQIALCASLLAGTGLLARSLWAMTMAPLGFDPDGVLTAAVQLPLRDYATPAAHARFFDRFTERLRALPGVNAVAHASVVPTAVFSRTSFGMEGAPPGGVQPFVLSAVVSDDYFRTLRIPVRQGRTFDARDDADAPPAVVISESMARRYWSGGDALGARIRLGRRADASPVEIVGIVADVRNDRARSDAEPMLYRPMRQNQFSGVTFLVRTGGDPLMLVRPIERQLAALDSGLALQRVRTLGEVADHGLAARRLPVLLMTAFGALALLVASVGVYAMFASMAAAREREFGIRMALGSRPRAIARLLLQQGAGWMGAGLAGGALGIVMVVRLVRRLLYEVSPFDPFALGAAVAILIGCAAIALLIPLRRATHVDPMVALRAL